MTTPGNIGKYEIRRQVGRGAMGVVYEAWDPAIARRVAIKALRLEVFESSQVPDVRERFRREAQSAGRLSHPHIVTIFDYGEHEGTPYIVMEFMVGNELSRILQRGTRLPISEIVRLMTQLLSALGYAHENKVVHRDIKPANILILDDGSLKVVDFGIARVEASNLTDTGALMGTPAYMSPEQFLSMPVDERSDIFSAGVILYELLTGDKPFTGSVTTIMQKVLHQDPLEPSVLNPTLSAAWDAVVKRAIAKKPDARFNSARQFAETIKQTFEAQNVSISVNVSMKRDTGDLYAGETLRPATAAAPPAAPPKPPEAPRAAPPPPPPPPPPPKVAPKPPAPQPAPAPGLSRSEQAQYWVAGLVVAAVIAVGAAFYLKAKSDQEAQDAVMRDAIQFAKAKAEPEAPKVEPAAPPSPPPAAAGLPATAPGQPSAAPEAPAPAPAAPEAAPANLPPIEIRIGSVAPLTGGIAHLGKDNENGVRLALEEANAAKLRVGGRLARFVLRPQDDKAYPKAGVAAANKLVGAKVAGVVGHLNSGTSIPAARVYNEAGIPAISGSASNPRLTALGFKGQFRVIGHDDHQGPAIAAYISSTIRPGNIAIVDDGTPYGEMMANGVEKSLLALRVIVLPRAQGTDSTKDWGTVLAKLAGYSPDVIFYGGMDNTAGPLLAQARERGMRMPFVTSDGGCTDSMTRLAGRAAEGMLCSQTGIPPTAADPRFLDAYKRRFKSAPILFAPFTYDAAMILIAAMKKADSAEPAKFVPELAKLSYGGATGRISFDANGDRRDAEVTIFAMKDRKLVPVAIVQGRRTMSPAEFAKFAASVRTQLN